MENATKSNRYDTKLPSRLRALLTETKTTQQQLADYCDVERQTIAKWKDGITCPDSDALCKLSQFFDVSADYLIGVSDNKTTDKATRALCDTLGLSDRSIAFLRGETEPLLVSALRDVNPHSADKLLTAQLDMIRRAVNYLIEDHIDLCLSSTADRSILENVYEFEKRLSMPERTVMSLYGMVSVKTPGNAEHIVGESKDGFWHLSVKEALLTSNIHDISADLIEKKNRALKKEAHNET